MSLRCLYCRSSYICLKYCQSTFQCHSWKLHKDYFFIFIWHNKAHRVASSVVLAPRSQGGMGAPDLIKNYYATHLKAIVTWSTGIAYSRWSEIEMSVTCPVHPCSIIWSALNTSMVHLWGLCLHPMLFTLSIWKKCSQQFSLSFPCPPLLNMLFNPDIPDSLSYTQMYPWTQAGIW